MNYNDLFKLDGKIAIVTGAARGIGLEISDALSQAGATVILTDVLADVGEAAAESLRSRGRSVEFIEHDVTNESQWDSVVTHTVSAHGRLDVLVNNAGIETAALITECEIEDFQRVMNINVTGVFLGHKYAMRVMKSGSSIINLSSVAGIIGSPGHVAYHTSKGAVRVMTKAAAVESAQMKTGIRVNSLHPGIINTDMGTGFVQGLVDTGLVPDFETADTVIGSIHPSGYGEPQDVASATLFLASEAARWITGAELAVDGGLTAA